MSEAALSRVERRGAGSAIADRLFNLRNRVLASERFQRWAAGFPLTRRVAQRRTRALFDLCAGFVYSQVLLACVRLRLFDALGDGAATPDELALQLSLPPAAAARLLDAAAALHLVERRRAADSGWACWARRCGAIPGSRR